MLEAVEDGQSVVQNRSDISVSEDGTISDESIQLMVEEFNMLEIFI